MKRYSALFFFHFFVFSLSFGQPVQSVLPPDKIYGAFFRDVHLSRVFPDGKTFVDCIPRRKPAEIVSDDEAMKGRSGFSLKKFVEENFELPANPADNYKTNEAEDVVTHIHHLWA